MNFDMTLTFELDPNSVGPIAIGGPLDKNATSHVETTKPSMKGKGHLFSTRQTHNVNVRKSSNNLATEARSTPIRLSAMTPYITFYTPMSARMQQRVLFINNRINNCNYNETLVA